MTLHELAISVAYALNMDEDDMDRFVEVFCDSVDGFVRGESDKTQDTVVDLVAYALSLSPNEEAKNVKKRYYTYLMTGE